MASLDEEGLTYLWEKIKSALSGKVDRVSGKGLSVNDYTTAEKNKLKGIVARAVVDFFGNFRGDAPRVVLNGESFEFENGLAQAVLNRLPVVFVDYRVGGGDCR